jgi:hypothetical protein
MKEPMLYDVRGGALLGRATGHNIAVVRRGAPLGKQHFRAYITCTCGALVEIAIRPERMDCWRSRRNASCRVLGGDTECWKFRERRRGGKVYAVEFSPAFNWPGHFRSQATWGAEIDDA